MLLIGENTTAIKFGKITGKPIESKTVILEEAVELSFYKPAAQSHIWQNVEGYKVDPQVGAEFEIETESLKTYFERNKSILLK